MHPVRRFVVLCGVFVPLTLLAACAGGGGASGAGALPKLSPDEQVYADEITANVNSQMPIEKARCAGAGWVKTLGLKRAKELDLANIKSKAPSATAAEAEKLYEIFNKCADARLVLMRSAKANAGLTDAQVISCAQVLDAAATKTYFLTVFQGKETGETDKTLTKQLNATVAKCGK
jgi:hypothetical protein